MRPSSRPFEVFVDRRVEKDLRRVPAHIRRKFLTALDLLAEDPVRARPGLDVKKLAGLPGETYRVRLGDYRLLFALERDRHRVLVTSLKPREKAYG